MGTKRLLYPGRVFDLVHCACCRVPWHIEGGKLLLELNRVLQPGGYFVWSATPVYQKLAEDVEIWTAMSAIKADPLCYEYDKESMVEAKFRKLEQETCDNNTASLPVACTLKNNTDLLACKAEYYHQSGEYQKCFELTSALLERDPFHLKSTLVHLTTAMELGHSNELYLMTCNLVKDYPQKALSWFVVGCYYYCIKKYSESRRFFSKATTLDGTFLPAWIGHGNAFAAQEEGDQAISSFRTAARSFPGCHLPTLYIGMEYMRTHNLKLAEKGDSKGSVKGGHGRKEVAGVQSGQSSQGSFGQGASYINSPSSHCKGLTGNEFR